MLSIRTYFFLFLFLFASLEIHAADKLLIWMPNSSYDGAKISKSVSALQDFFEKKKASITVRAMNQRTELEAPETKKEQESSSFFLLNHSTYQALKKLGYQLTPLLQSSFDGKNETKYYIYSEKTKKNSLTSLPVYMTEPFSESYFSFLFSGTAIEKNHGRFEFIGNPLNLLKLMEARDHRIDYAHYSPLVLLSENEKRKFEAKNTKENVALVFESKNIPNPALFVRSEKNNMSERKFYRLMLKFQKTKEGKEFLKAFKISSFGKHVTY